MFCPKENYIVLKKWQIILYVLPKGKLHCADKYLPLDADHLKFSKLHLQLAECFLDCLLFGQFSAFVYTRTFCL